MIRPRWLERLDDQKISLLRNRPRLKSYLRHGTYNLVHIIHLAQHHSLRKFIMGRRKKRQVIGKSNVVKFNHAQLPSTTTWSANPNAKEMQKKVSLIKSTTGPFCQDRITSNIETIKKNRQRQKHNHKAPESIEQHIIAQIDQNQVRCYLYSFFKNQCRN